MPELASSMAIASIIVGLLTIPAASKSLTNQTQVSDSLPNISTEKVPKEVQTQSSADSFSRTIDTAFKEFTTKVESEEASSSVETPESKLSISRTPEKTEAVLNSPKGSLKIIESAEKVEKVVETPHGTLETVQEDGGTEINFEGSNREKVEKIGKDLRKEMDRKRAQIEDRNQQSRAQRLAKDLELGIHEEKPEHVTLNNTGKREINLNGWKLQNNNPSSYKLSGVLNPGETLRIYSEDKEELNITEDEKVSYVYGSGLTWENGGDTATLKLGTGHKVLSRES